MREFMYAQCIYILLSTLGSIIQIKEIIQMEIMKAKISVTVERKFVDWIDSQIKTMRFRNRSHAVEYALAKLLEQERKE